MRIVDRKKFLALPSNTVYRKYAPCYYQDLCIKFETIDNRFSGDFFLLETQGFIEGCKDSGEVLEAHDYAEQSGQTYRFDLDSSMRDGEFEDDQLFAVYDNEDIQQLIDKLKECIK
jgi:hypothetical protein